MNLVRGSLLLLLLALLAVPALADPCLVVYPVGACTYHYDVNEYTLVGPGDPAYDPAYDLGGWVLIDQNDGQVALDIYQAPGLFGFEPSTMGKEGYFFEGHSFQLVIDGFNNEPITYQNVLVMIEPLPLSCPPNVVIDGNPVVGGSYALGDLVVSTPTGEGNNYSDTIVLDVSWDSCAEMEFWAFADEDFDGHRTGPECFSAYSHDTTVPVESTSWGSLKGRFGSEE